MSYLFLDLETTGLDPAENKILEIAWATTDHRFNTVGVPKKFVVEQDDWQGTWTQLKMSQFVTDMHTKNGLIDDMSDDDLKKHTLDEIYESLVKDVMYVRDMQLDSLHLAGLSVHFDKAFLDANDFKGLWGGEDRSALIHHRILDLSSFKLLMDSSGLDMSSIEAPNDNPHRAFYDVCESVGLARNVQSFLQKVEMYA